MSIMKNNKIIAVGDVNTNTYRPPILSCMWSDHLINDIQWLRADTFSWQSGDVYKTVYDKLVEEYNGATETYNDGWFSNVKKTASGLKIVTQAEEQAVLDKYNNDGIAWYYILDVTNKRFKLPRMKYKYWKNFTNDTLPVKGNGNMLGLYNPNATGNNLGFGITATQYLAYGVTKQNDGNIQAGATINDVSTNRYVGGVYGVTIDASKSGIVTDSTSIKNNVEETGFYLYFYVGEYAQTAIEQTAGLNSELFNGKLDVSTYNANPRNEAVYLKTTYVDGTSGYRIWSDGYCEQWGHIAKTTSTVSLTKTYANTNYNISATNSGTGYSESTPVTYDKTVNSFVIKAQYQDQGRERPMDWVTRGYLATGQY